MFSILRLNLALRPSLRAYQSLKQVRQRTDKNRFWKSSVLPFKAFVKKSNVIFTKHASREPGEGERTASEFSCLTFFSSEEQGRAMGSDKDLVLWGFQALEGA